MSSLHINVHATTHAQTTHPPTRSLPHARTHTNTHKQQWRCSRWCCYCSYFWAINSTRSRRPTPRQRQRKKGSRSRKSRGAARGRGRTSELASHGSLIQEGQECWAGAFRARCPRAAKGIVYCQPDSAGLSHVSKLQQRLSVPMDQ